MIKLLKCLLTELQVQVSQYSVPVAPNITHMMICKERILGATGTELGATGTELGATGTDWEPQGQNWEPQGQNPRKSRVTPLENIVEP